MGTDKGIGRCVCMDGMIVSRLVVPCVNEAVRHKIQSGSFGNGWSCPVPMVMEVELGVQTGTTGTGTTGTGTTGTGTGTTGTCTIGTDTTGTGTAGTGTGTGTTGTTETGTREKEQGGMGPREPYKPQELVVLIQDPSQLDTIKHGEVSIGVVKEEEQTLTKDQGTKHKVENHRVGANRYEFTLGQYGVQESSIEGYGHADTLVDQLVKGTAWLRPRMEWIHDMFGEHVSFADVLDGNIGEAECDHVREMKMILELVNELERGEEGIMLGSQAMDIIEGGKHITF